MAHAYIFLYVRTLHHHRHRHRRVNDFPSSSCPLQRVRPSSLLGFAAAVDRRIDGGLVKLGDIRKLKGVCGVR